MDEVPHDDPGPSAIPFYERPGWRSTFAFVAVLLILLVLWVVFPSEYWRF